MQQPPIPLSDIHREFLTRALDRLSADPRVVGLAATGSVAAGTQDAFSDLDLLVAVEPRHLDDLLAARRDLAGALGTLLSAFTGEHVGEPRLLICLFGPPLLHVDLKFAAVDQLGPIVGPARLLWARDDRLAVALAASAGAELPAPDPQWIEDRFWVWVHYAASKIRRGELYETLDFLAYLRSSVLAPMARARIGTAGIGLRRLEQEHPALAERLQPTVAAHDAQSCLTALRACVRLYRELRSTTVTQRVAAEAAAVHDLG